MALMSAPRSGPQTCSVAPNAAAAFGATLHVCGPDRAALERAIAPFRREPGLTWEEAEPTLEDVFIHLMGRARDNALDG